MEQLMPFGKYKGKTIAEIRRIDPNYLKWLKSNTSFKIQTKNMCERKPPEKNTHWYQYVD